MTKPELFDFMRRHRLAVLATVSEDNHPEAAVIGFAVTPELDILFDTVRSARKYKYMLANPRVALVIGWDREVTVQYEGIAEEPSGAELERCQACYFGALPDGHERLKWPG